MCCISLAGISLLLYIPEGLTKFLYPQISESLGFLVTMVLSLS